MSEAKSEVAIDALVMQHEHLFWLAAQDIVFFFNTEPKDGLFGWTAAVNCNDTFFYASADAEELAPSEAHKVRDYYDRYGWAGVVAWAAKQRNMEPLKELQDENYQAARKELDAA